VSVRTTKKSRYSSPESPPRRLFIYSPTRRDGSVRETFPALSLPAPFCVRDFPAGGKRCLSDSGRNSREISPRKSSSRTRSRTIAIVVSSNLPIGIPSSTAMAAATVAAAACTGGSKLSRGGKKGVERGRAEAEETACR